METVASILKQLSPADAASILNELADSIRIVNPYTKIILFDKGSYKGDCRQDCSEKCHSIWEASSPCENCVAMCAIESGQKQVKVEFFDNRIFLITAVPIQYQQCISAIEITRDITALQYVEGLGDIGNPAVDAKFMELALLAKVSSYMNAGMELKVLLKQMVNDIQRIVRVEEAAIYFANTKEWFSAMSDQDRSTEPAEILRDCIQGAWQKDLFQYQCFHFWAGQSPHIDVYLRQHGWAAIVSMPIVTNNKIYGYIVLGTRSDPQYFQQPWLQYLHRMAEQVAVVIEHTLLLQDYQEKRKLEEEMRLAVAIHQTLLPKIPPKFPECWLAVFYQPAASVGGDYYDFLDFGTKTAIIMGDIKGKGMGAALLMVHLRSLVRAKAKMHRSSQAVVHLVNDFITNEHNEEMLASLVYGVWDHSRHTFTYCNAGHPYPLVYRADTGNFERLEKGGLIIGIFAGECYEEESVTLNEGDILVLVTDGITEAGNGIELYGEARLKDEIVTHAMLESEQIRDAIIRSVREFTKQETATDDRTLIVLKRQNMPHLGEMIIDAC